MKLSLSLVICVLSLPSIFVKGSLEFSANVLTAEDAALIQGQLEATLKEIAQEHQIDVDTLVAQLSGHQQETTDRRPAQEGPLPQAAAPQQEATASEGNDDESKFSRCYIRDCPHGHFGWKDKQNEVEGETAGDDGPVSQMAPPTADDGPVAKSSRSVQDLESAAAAPHRNVCREWLEARQGLPRTDPMSLFCLKYIPM